MIDKENMTEVVNRTFQAQQRKIVELQYEVDRLTKENELLKAENRNLSAVIDYQCMSWEN